MKVEKRGCACGNPRAIREKVQLFNLKRKAEEMEGSLYLKTFDIKGFFSNV